jgi:hypothetical protein
MQVEEEQAAVTRKCTEIDRLSRVLLLLVVVEVQAVEVGVDLQHWQNWREMGSEQVLRLVCEDPPHGGLACHSCSCSCSYC